MSKQFSESMSKTTKAKAKAKSLTMDEMIAAAHAVGAKISFGLEPKPTCCFPDHKKFQHCAMPATVLFKCTAKHAGHPLCNEHLPVAKEALREVARMELRSAVTVPDQFDYESYAVNSTWRDHLDRMGFRWGKGPLWRLDGRECFRGDYGPYLTLCIYVEGNEARIVLWQRYGEQYKALNTWMCFWCWAVGTINIAAKAARACRKQQTTLGQIAYGFIGAT